MPWCSPSWCVTSAKGERQRALLYGLGGAFVFRLMAIVFAASILHQWWLQALGGSYLLFLAVHHLVRRGSDRPGGKDLRHRGFWPTVVAVELTDVAFALDSVLASIAFITVRDARGVPDVQEEKIWVVVTGAMIGIVLLRFAAARVSKLLERRPTLNAVAYVLVGWVGLKLVSHALHRAPLAADFPRDDRAHLLGRSGDDPHPWRGRHHQEETLNERRVSPGDLEDSLTPTVERRRAHRRRDE